MGTKSVNISICDLGKISRSKKFTDNDIKKTFSIDLMPYPEKNTEKKWMAIIKMFLNVTA